MNNTDNMLTFLDAWLLAERGDDPSIAIENQEKRGQAELVRTQRLPQRLNDHNIPNEIIFKDVPKDLDYKDKHDLMMINIKEYTKAQYERMGIRIVDCADDIFYNVVLPDGWEIRATEHTMWNEVLDDKGRKRMTIFYKAAFYDRDAFANLQTRFQLDVTHVADPNSDYDVWKASDIQGTVKDGDRIIYQTARVPACSDYTKESKMKDVLWEDLYAFMNEHWPRYKDVHAYWNAEVI